MPLSFRTLAAVSAALCFALAIAWLLAPALLLTLWGVGFSEPVGLVSRRVAALFLGVGIMFFMARNAGPSDARLALASGFGAACTGLAVLGGIEWLRGGAGPGILSAVVVEVALAAAYLSFIRAERRQLRTAH